MNEVQLSQSKAFKFDFQKIERLAKEIQEFTRQERAQEKQNEEITVHDNTRET